MSDTGLDIDDATLQELSEKDIDDIVESIDPDVSPAGGREVAERGGPRIYRVVCVCVAVDTPVVLWCYRRGDTRT